MEVPVTGKPDSQRSRRPGRRRPPTRPPVQHPHSEMEAGFAFIAGYTSGGAPFGLTFAELADCDPSAPAAREDAEPGPDDADLDLPF